MSKPWAPFHVSEVAKGVGIDLRISGEVKESLVSLLQSELKKITRNMEEKTLEKDSNRKTLDDPSRTRLGFNRTRGLMIDEIVNVESVSSAAVVSANEKLEDYLRSILISASEVASSEKMGTIKQRHLDLVLSSSESRNDSNFIDPAENANKEFHNDSLHPKFEVLTSVSMRTLVKQFSGKKLENDAIDELVLLYYDYASDIEYNLQKYINRGDVDRIRESYQKFEQLMMLGWMRRVLKIASEKADAQGSSLIRLDHIVAVDPWS
jgi:histone H3/H4